LTAVARLSRRHFLGACGAGAAAGALDAFALEPNWLEVTEHTVPLDGLPGSVEGLTVAQITDAHLNVFGRVERAIVDAVGDRSVSIVALTGDIVEDEAGLAVLTELCSSLRSTGAALVAILGNWEHWSRISLNNLADRYARVGAKLLVNEATSIKGLAMVGTDDALAGQVDWKRALADAKLDRPSLLLTHGPDLLDHAPAGLPRFGFALAGHTHGGQGRLGSWAPLVPPGSGRFLSGHYETPLGRAYVSRGTGTSIVPARLFCRPELPIFRLTRG
jgi:uncharacterized protein